MLKGSIVALVTPMHQDGSLDEDALAKLIEFHIKSETDGIVITGTSGEASTLSIKEQIGVIDKTVSLVSGRVPVIAGTGANSTTEAVTLTQGAKSVGVDACLLVVPYYIKPTQHGMAAHFRHIADAVDVPQILYNVPGRSVVDMLPDTVAELASHENIVGIKDAGADISRVAGYVRDCGEDFALYSGDDATTRLFIEAGGHGAISVTANVAPQKMHDMCQAAINGDFVAAEAIDATLQALHRDLFIESSPIPAKWAVSKLGFCQPHMRLPMTTLSAQYESVVLAAMQEAGVI